MFEILHHLIWGCVQPCLYSGKKTRKTGKQHKTPTYLAISICFGRRFFPACTAKKSGIFSPWSRKLYLLDPINLGDFLSALALPLLVSVNFAHHLPESTMETAIHHILCLGCGLKSLFSILKVLVGWFFLNGKKTTVGFSGGKCMVAVGLCVLVLG